MQSFRITVHGHEPYDGIFASSADAWMHAQKRYPDSVPTAVINLTRLQQRQQAA